MNAIHHIALSVADRETSKAIYEKLDFTGLDRVMEALQ
jgi:catechol 2,3-dioxygenase-like lactoylglutathione lyase family enzyme